MRNLSKENLIFVFGICIFATVSSLDGTGGMDYPDKQSIGQNYLKNYHSK
jgi:hypothetical protein